LESILRVCLVAQHAVADLQHHRAVAEQERVKGGPVSLASEAPQQLRVGQLAHAFIEGDPADKLQDRAGRALGHRAVPGKRKWALHRYSSFRRLEEAVFLQRNAPFAWREGKAARSVVWFEPQAVQSMTVVGGTPANHRLKRTGAALLVFRASTPLQAALAA